MALPKNYKPKITKKLRDLKTKLYDVIESVHVDDRQVYIKLKKGWIATDGSNYIIGPTATDVLRRFQFKKAVT